MAEPQSSESSQTAGGATRPSLFKLVLNQTLITDEVRRYDYAGSGTSDDPFVVDFIPDDPKNGFNLSPGFKWFIVLYCAWTTLACSLSSTIFAGAILQIEGYFHVREEVSILAVALFVLGFAVGPVIWGPLCELYGRQVILAITVGGSLIFAGTSIACNENDIAALLVLRFLTGSFSSAAISNSPAVLADIFLPAERGLAVMVYSTFPFLGPTLGPICGNFLGASAGWRWVDVLCTLLFAIAFIVGLLFVPETYGPYILRRRAAKLSTETGKAYISKLDVGVPRKTLGSTLTSALTRPMVMTVMEPISTALAIYMAIIYGILYLIFAAFPIVYITERHWTQGVSGLAYVGIMVGQIIAMPLYVVMELRYRKKIAQPGVVSTPEMRLEPAMWGAVLLPLSLFWFAWTTYTSVHWAVGIVGTVFFGMGNVLVFISIINYLMDTYSLLAATAAACNSIIRALFGFAFPLFTTHMYENLGTQWASSVPAFLALAFAPLPFLLLKVGPSLRARSKFANEAKEQMAKLMEVRHKVEEKLNKKHVDEKVLAHDQD